VVFKSSVNISQDATVQRHFWDSETIDTDAHMDVDKYIEMDIHIIIFSSYSHHLLIIFSSSSHHLLIVFSSSHHLLIILSSSHLLIIFSSSSHRLLIFSSSSHHLHIIFSSSSHRLPYLSVFEGSLMSLQV